MKYDGRKARVIFIGCRLPTTVHFAFLPMLLSAWLFNASGCETTKSGATNTNMLRTDLFRLHCSRCHGDGSGNGHIASTLAVRPRNLKQMEWQASVTDSHILQVIRSGGIKHKLSDKMPGFADKLTDQQIQSLVEYIRSLRD